MKMAEDNRRLRPQSLNAVSGVCLTFGVQNLNPQQEKALAEFLVEAMYLLTWLQDMLSP